MVCSFSPLPRRTSMKLGVPSFSPVRLIKSSNSLYSIFSSPTFDIKLTETSVKAPRISRNTTTLLLTGEVFFSVDLRKGSFFIKQAHSGNRMADVLGGRGGRVCQKGAAGHR